MKKNIFLLLCLISLCAIVACSDKKQSQTIITHKPKKEIIKILLLLHGIMKHTKL